MQVTINGKTHSLKEKCSLMHLIDDFCKENPHVVLEVNGQTIKQPQWKETRLNDGDTIELLSFVGGG